MIYSMLKAIFEGKYGQLQSFESYYDRVLELFDNVVKNFSGLLLKETEGSLMQKTLQLLEQHAPPAFSQRIVLSKSISYAQQRDMLSLVNFEESGSRTPSDPFTEISSSVFMNDVNLLEFASLITEIDLHFFKKWNASIDKSLLLTSMFGECSTNESCVRKNSLVFNNDSQIHYLSRLLIFHIFAEDTSNKTAERRARILERWIDLGCLLDKSGNMSSWLGIASVIMSQPILRLRGIWSHVRHEYIKLLRNDWSPVLFELDRRYLSTINETVDPNRSTALLYGDSISEVLPSKESYHIMAPRGLGKIYSKNCVIPYFGDLVINNRAYEDFSKLENIWKKVIYSFERWNEYLENFADLKDIINYNQDVLRRYNSMGFIFSNESLNQVLYLGANREETSVSSSSLMATNPVSETISAITKKRLRKALLRLIELNEEPTSLDEVMICSLKMEPSSPEKYLRNPGPTDVGINFASDLQSINFSTSNISLHSASSYSSGPGNVDNVDETTSTVKKDISYADRLPTFNNEYFKIDLSKYDELVSSSAPHVKVIDSSHEVVASNDLVLRLDDFVPDFETQSLSSSVTQATEGKAEVDNGLGIDVEDLFASDKLRGFTAHVESNDEKNKERRHRSFGLISNHSNHFLSHSKQPNYVPRIASLDTLIDLVLIDSTYFDDDHRVDLRELRFVFLLSYSSFMTTKELLTSLAHRFVHSGNAVISIMKKQYLVRIGEYDPIAFGKFPNWDIDRDVNLTELGDVDYELLLKIQINILKVLIVLLNNFYDNFAHDLSNKRTLIKFFKLYTNEILQWYNSNKIDKNLDKYFEELVNHYKKLKKLFVKKIYRPIEISKFESFLTHEFRFSNVLHDVPMNRNLPSHKNIHKIEKFIHKFNKLLTVFYMGIKPEDWFKAFNILENQCENFSLLNYAVQSELTEEQLRISNIFSYFDSLKDGSDNEFLITKFPLVFRKLFQLYHKFKCYLYIQLCDPNISMDERLDRMKTLLIMVKISRIKMGDSQFVFEGSLGTIPSCIESAIVNTIYHPASRLLSSLWMKASLALDAQYNEHNLPTKIQKVGDLLPTGLKEKDLLTAHEPLLPCFGWIFELLIEVNRCPNFHRNAVNFNKRYLVFKLIRELSVEDVDDTQLEAGEFDFLLKLDESVCQTIKLSEICVPERHTYSIFESMLDKQSLINTSEMAKKTGRLQKFSNDETSNQKSKAAGGNVRRQSLNYKTNASSRFKISGLFNRLNNASSEKIVEYEELPVPGNSTESKSKPLHVMHLKDFKIFPVYSLTNCLKVDSDKGDVLYLRAHNEDEMSDWFIRLAYANRHWFKSRHLNSKIASPYITFNIPLHVVCIRDKARAPLVLSLMYDAIEKIGLNDVGIYRISTSISELSALRHKIDSSSSVDFDSGTIDVHAITSCVKMFFRELPDAIFTDEVMKELIHLKKENDLNKAASENSTFNAMPFSLALRKLPKYNYYTLKALIGHLHRVSNKSDQNRMNASNLATVIGPALTEANSAEAIVSSFGFINFIMEKLITNWEGVFNDEEEINNY